MEDIKHWISEVVSHELAAVPDSVTQIIGSGEVNQAYDVRTPEGSFIFRTNSGEEELTSYLKEQWCAEQAHAVGVPTPEILVVKEDKGQAYSIQQKIPGISGEKVEGDTLPMWREIGQHARLINSIPTGGCGYAFDLNKGGFYESWGESLDGALSYAFEDDALIKMGIFSEGELESVRARFDKLRSWQFEPRLCHANLALDNVIQGDDGQVYIIDWGTAQGHRAPHWELVDPHLYYGSHEVKAFCEGYGISDEAYSDMKDDLNMAVLYRALSAARWAFGVGKPDVERYAVRARRTYEGMFSGIPKKLKGPDLE